MSKDKKTYRTLSEEEIRDYLAGKISGRKAHEIERHLLNSSFDQEALEGFEQNIDAFQDLSHLRERVMDRSVRKGTPWLRVAAAVVLLMVSVSVVWWLLGTQSDPGSTIAMKEEAVTPPHGPQDQGEIRPPDVPEKQTGEPLQEKPKAEAHPTFSAKPLADATVPLHQSAEEESTSAEAEEYLAVESKDEITFDLNEEMLDEELKLKATEAVATERSKKADGVAKELNEAEPAALSIRGAASGVSRSSSMGNLQVSGQVTDEVGEPLPGVSVVVKGSTTGAVTDLNGNYQLSIPDENAVLQFSFIGMESAETPVNGKSEVNMELESDVAALSEVVVVGYGVSKKKSVTGAVTTVDTEDLTNNYEKPQPSGGLDAFKSYLENSLVYPTEAKEKEVEGKVVLKLTIDVAGEITDIEIKRSVGYGCDEEAIRLVREGPEWKPAKRDDQPTESTVKVKVKFEL